MNLTEERLQYLELLSQKFPSPAQVSTEIINLNAILGLPKGTEHFISDIHGEYRLFLHILKNASGSALKQVLGKATQNLILGVITGMLVTAVIQSSTATIVLTVGLISANILDLKQAVSIVMGANIGTTVTAQIIRLMDIESGGSLLMDFFKPSTLAPLALIVGVVLIMFVKSNKSMATGEIFAGFGILFSGLLNMTAAVTPLSESQAFLDLMQRFSNYPLIAILLGLVMTVIVQSSSAMVGMIQALSVTGAMTFNLVYPLIMGINLGTCVTTALVCSIGSSKDAKRVGIVHIAFNVIGTILFMIVMTIIKSMGGFPNLWESVANSGSIANFQTLFNLVTAIALIPFAGFLPTMCRRPPTRFRWKPTCARTSPKPRSRRKRRSPVARRPRPACSWHRESWEARSNR